MNREKPHTTKVSNIFIKIFVFLFVFLSPFFTYSTHIVGGALTYVYNGGSNYTITLKLYRDCGGGSAAFPDPVVIAVAGYNGASFSPSLDISIPLGTVTPVPSNLDTCADPPSPMPCVEEGIYTTTVTNLPPNPGGYHLYFQVCCRNGSVINCVTPLSTGGSFYAYIPGTSYIWFEDFTLTNGTTSDAGATAWSITPGTPAPTYAEVNNNLFEFSGNNDASSIWTSQVIDISSYSLGVNISVDLSENSGLEANDSIIVYYSLDGGPLIQFTANGSIADDFGSVIATVNALIGSSIQIFVYVHYDGASSGEIYRCDNVLVSGNDFQPNNNAAFTLFPPLFLCVGQPFSFDHSATDANGDSLVYSFYTPYDDIAPTFTNNQTNFTPITWVGGFSATNPLGGTPLNLNSATGLLTGAPTTLGQYVVGVMVKEYRNGICIDSTMRDFQFNVVDCPPPATAVLPDTIFGCSGLSISFSNQGNPATNNWWNFGDPAVTNDTSTLANPTYTYPNEGFYTAVLITNKGTFCADTDSAVVFVGWVDAGFTGDTVGCAGDLFDFNDTSSSSSNLTITGYQWDFGDGGTSTAEDASHIYITDGSYTVTHIVTTDMGCSDTVTKTVTVNPAPVFVVDMTGNPDSVWASPSVVRDCKVCGATGMSNVCITFILTLDPGTQAISFDLIDGAIPQGSLYYQINCGDSNQVKDTICFSGVGPHQITFCKPGNNPNVYQISAITAPEVSPPVTVSDGCTDTISAIGYIESSVTWTSVSPGAQGTYDTYLDCPTGCDTVIVTSQPGYPTSVDYMVCGLPIGGGSCSMTPVCDTTTVYFVTTLATTINPLNPTICFGGSNTTITAAPSGGAPPYSYQWSTGEISAAISVGVGTYFVTVSDTTKCEPVTDSIVVTAFSSAITANAGPDQTVCNNYPDVALSGIVTAANGGTWFGGNGTFSPNADSLNATYTPTVAEILSGSMQLFLVTTGNGSCPADTDTMAVSFIYFSASVSVSPTDALCFGDSSGTATATVSGGLSPITYLWNTGATTDSVSNLPAAAYSVTVTENNGCDTLISINIDEPDSLVAVISNSSNVNCFGGSNGTATVSASGGISPYSYLWNDSQSDSTAIGLVADTFYITITDDNGCTATANTIINEPSELLVSISSANAVCYNDSNGTATVTPSGGTSPYTYLWSNGQNDSTATGLSAGTYFVTVTDSNGCSLNNSHLITQPDSIIIIISVTGPSCYPETESNVYFEILGGTPPFTYTLIADDTTPTGTITFNCGLTITFGGPTFTLIIVDSLGCNVSLDGSSPPIPTQLNIFPSGFGATCFGSDDGFVSVSANGATTPYSFVWDTGDTIQSFGPVPPDSYCVTVTDANGCQDVDTCVNVTEPQPINISIIPTPVSCNGGSDGEANLSVSGGTPGFSFLWSNGGNGIAINTLSTGNYSVTVTDNNSCTGTASTFVNEPSILNVSTSSTPVSCKNGNNGTATASASGGNGGFIYSWSNGGNGTTISNLTAGTYFVTATDSKNCTATTSITVTEPSTLLSLDTSSTFVICKGEGNGTATVMPSGGISPYFYLWDTNANSQTTSTSTGLFSGIYNVTVTDSNNCVLNTSVNIEEPATLLSLDISSTMVICNGDDNGTATVIPSGGVSPYFYLWAPNANSQTTATATGLIAGTYSITVTDNNNCAMDTIVYVAQPFSPLSITISTDSVKCYGGNDGSAIVTPSGGTSPYTYEWDDANLQTDSAAIGLNAGTYSVTVTDNTQNCKVGNSVIIGEPDSLVLTTSTTNVSCFGGNDGTAAVAVNGGISPYTYLWSTLTEFETLSGLVAGNYSVTVTDNNNCADSATVNIAEPAAPLSISSLSSTNVNCNGGSDGTAAVAVAGGTLPYFYEWSTGDSVSSVSDLPASDYFVTITDTNNCTTDTSVTITEPFSGLTASTNVTYVNCFGGNDGTATVTPAGGTSPYFYQWDSSANSQTDSTATGLISGTYSVTVNDNNGCIVDTISTVIVGQPATYVSATTSQINVSCSGGSDGTAAISATGGTPPYSYLWNDSNSQTDSTATGLVAGTYNATVTDNNGCANDTTTIIISEPQPLTLITSKTDLKCKGDSDGTAAVTVTGGTSPYFYEWSNGDSVSSVSGLPASDYFVTITDTNNCSIDTFVTISEPDSFLLLATSFTDVLCFGDSNGTATVIPGGGIPPYSYQWDSSTNSQTDSTATGLKKGTYSVIVTDANGCVDSSKTVSVSEPEKILATASDNDTICPNTNETISVAGNGGTGNYSYLWNNNDTNQSQVVSPASNTNYTVVITDANGCTSNKDTVVVSVRIYYFDSLLFSCGTAANCTLCIGDSTQISATYFEEFPPYNYQWENDLGTGLGPKTISPETTTDYILKVSDQCGFFRDTLTIYVDTFPIISMPEIYDEQCVPLTVNFENSIQNPDGSTYFWKFGDGVTSPDSTPTHFYTNDGTYYVSLVIISPSGCSDTVDTATTVIVRPLPQPSCSATPAVATLQNPVINFSTENFKTYFWEFADGDSSSTQNPVHTYKDSGEYTVSLLVTNQYDCENTCEVIIRINPLYPLGIPNAFTPDPNGSNGGTYSFDDFTNNVFFPITRYVTDYHMEIFNRWGELLYESFEINKGWDGYYRGELCQQDVYVWKIYIKWWDMQEFSGIGDVTLLK